MLKRYAALASLLALVAVAPAQVPPAPTIDLLKVTTNPSPCVATCSVVIDWQTSNTPGGCTASDAWSGAKAASGSQTISTVTASSKFSLSCKGAGDTAATLVWDAPTQNTDGTALTTLAKYRIFRGTSAATLAQIAEINAPASQLALTNQPAGTQTYGLEAVRADGIASDMSETRTKSFSAPATASSSASMTVVPKPNPPVFKSIDTTAYQYTAPATDTIRLAVVGKVAKGIACTAAMDVNGFHVVPKAKITNWTISASARNALRVVVAKCA